MPLADPWHRVAFHGAIHGVRGAMRCASYEETTLEFHLSYDDSFQTSEVVLDDTVDGNRHCSSQEI